MFPLKSTVLFLIFYTGNFCPPFGTSGLVWRRGAGLTLQGCLDPSHVLVAADPALADVRGANATSFIFSRAARILQEN